MIQSVAVFLTTWCKKYITSSSVNRDLIFIHHLKKSRLSVKSVKLSVKVLSNLIYL